MTLRSVLLGLVALVSLAACGIDDSPELGRGEELLPASGPPGAYQVSPVPRASTHWRYDDTGTDRGTAWRTGDTSTWAEGTGPLGYGEPYLATVVSYGGNPADKHRTTYFRHAFLKNSGRVLKMYLRVMYDDGFVFYLNGREGGRANMPGGTITYPTLATGHEADDRYVTYDISAQIPNLSEAGPNTLAVEVHQASASSSDLVFDAELVLWMEGTYDYPSSQGIARGEMWTFWDQPGAPTASWKLPTHDDTGWKTGSAPLGYGEPYILTETTPGRITTYFHHDFLAGGPVHGLTADVRYDDGFVAYLNGTEIARRSMPAGPITETTPALDHEAVAYEHLDWSAAAALVHDGVNTLAIEVHQTSTASSDLVFDLGLQLTGGWQAQVSGTTAPLYDVELTSPTQGYVVGAAGTLLVTSDGGAHWTRRELAPGLGNDLDAIEFTDADHGVIVGTSGLVYTTDDAGLSWTPRTAPTFDDLLDLTADGDELWATSNDATLYHSTDGGVTWTAVYTGIAGGSFRAVSFFGADHGWIAGEIPFDGDSRSVIYGTDDGGATWTQQWMSSLHGHYLFDLDRTEEDRAWAVGGVSLSGQGEWKLQTTDGDTWTTEPATSNDSAIYGVDFLDGSRGWGVGYNGTIIHTTDGGASWHVQVPTVGGAAILRAVAFADGEHGLAVGLNGTILATTSGGE